jgi:hypothetical protein
MRKTVHRPLRLMNFLNSNGILKLLKTHLKIMVQTMHLEVLLLFNASKVINQSTENFQSKKASKC